MPIAVVISPRLRSASTSAAGTSTTSSSSIGSSSCAFTSETRGAKTVDIRPEPEAEYAAHCRDADMATAPLRDCISYYNGDGKAEPGSLAYYGGRGWARFKADAQASMEPYAFG